MWYPHAHQGNRIYFILFLVVGHSNGIKDYHTYFKSVFFFYYLGYTNGNVSSAKFLLPSEKQYALDSRGAACRHQGCNSIAPLMPFFGYFWGQSVVFNGITKQQPGAKSLACSYGLVPLIQWHQSVNLS